MAGAIALCEGLTGSGSLGYWEGVDLLEKIDAVQIARPASVVADLPDPHCETRNKLYPPQDVLMTVLCVVRRDARVPYGAITLERDGLFAIALGRRRSDLGRRVGYACSTSSALQQGVS